MPGTASGISAPSFWKLEATICDDSQAQPAALGRGQRAAVCPAAAWEGLWDGRVAGKAWRPPRSAPALDLDGARRIPDWPGVEQVCTVERVVVRPGRRQREIRHAITSLGPVVGAARLLGLVRGHWAIENRLHWVRDVTLGEDPCWVRPGDGASGAGAAAAAWRSERRGGPPRPRLATVRRPALPWSQPSERQRMKRPLTQRSKIWAGRAYRRAQRGLAQSIRPRLSRNTLLATTQALTRCAWGV